jgi:putative addiction module component (TIGR02574 family)
MTRETKELLERALKLPLKERAKLAKSIMESVDEESDDPVAVEKAWAAEIKRRVRDIDEGRVKGIPGDKVREFVRRKVEAARKRRRG